MSEQNPQMEIIRQRMKKYPNKVLLGKLVGCSKQNIYAIIRGEYEPGGNLLLNLLRELKIQIANPPAIEVLTPEHVERVREAAGRYDKSPRALADAAHEDPDLVRDFIKKSLQWPRVGMLRSLAHVLKVPLPEMPGAHDDDPVDSFFRGMKSRRHGLAPVLTSDSAIPLADRIMHAPDLSDQQRDAILCVIRKDYPGAIRVLATMI